MKALIIACFVYIILESLWLFLTKSFYTSLFANFSKDGTLKIRSYIAIVIVYPLLLLGAWLLFLRNNYLSPLESFWKGALFGAIVYGVYNLTNMATLPGYSWKMVAVDTLWGVVVFSVFSVVYVQCKNYFLLHS